MKDFGKRAASLLLAVACALTLCVSAGMPASAVSQADVNALKKEAQTLETKKQDLKKKINKLAGDKEQALERQKLLDEQIAVTAGEIHNAEQQIAAYSTLITKTEAELAEAEAKEEEQYALFCDRVRIMEKDGKVDYWSVLFHATSFTDLLSRLDMVSEIMKADQRIMDELQALQDEITEKKASLEKNQAEFEAAKASLEQKKATLNTQREEAVQLTRQIESDQATYNDALKKLDQEEDAIQAKAVALSQQMAGGGSASHHSSGQSSGGAYVDQSPTRGGYIWPVGSRTINSPFGPRRSPGGVGSRYHKGIDIGGVGFSTPVHAAKSGVVVISQRSSSYGNYVVVAHGNGNTTTYAHMSSRSVSVGQHVNQGDVLGITGSTGHSTGPHLHFEITENGQRVNPLNYLGGYVRNW